MSTMGVKQLSLLSPTLFILFIDKLEDFVCQIDKEEGDNPIIGAFTPLVFIYVDHVAIFECRSLIYKSYCMQYMPFAMLHVICKCDENEGQGGLHA